MPRDRRERERSLSPYLVNKAKREEAERRGKDKKWRGSTSTESGGDDDETATTKKMGKGAKKVAAMAAVRAKMRGDLAKATSNDVIDITDDTMHGPIVNPLRPIDIARQKANRDDIDRGLAFQPAAFRSSRADKKKADAKRTAAVVDNIDEHEAAMFGDVCGVVSSATMHEGPLLPNQASIADVSNADTVESLLVKHYGPNSIILPDCIFGASAKRQNSWKSEWKRLREAT